MILDFGNETLYFTAINIFIMPSLICEIDTELFRQSEKFKRHVSTIICSEIVAAGELHLGLISTEQIKMMEICIRSFSDPV